jgi:hypothetical protein
VCGINDPGHTYDENLILLAKSGMTEEHYLTHDLELADVVHTLKI